MPKFRIPVSWRLSAVMEIEADNLIDACNKAWDEDLPEGDYVDDSFEADSYWAEQENEKLIPPD